MVPFISLAGLELCAYIKAVEPSASSKSPAIRVICYLRSLGVVDAFSGEWFALPLL
jgi:hypothetical protein